MKMNVKAPHATVTLITIMLVFSLNISGQEIVGIGRGILTPSLSTPKAGLLRSFYFRFLHDDHPLQYIAAHPLGNKVEVAFADRDPSAEDDDYNYKLISLPSNNPAIIEKSASLAICIGSCELHDEQLKNVQFHDQYVFVLRGFKFTYARDDYAIKRIRITEDKGVIVVSLHDRGGLNQFSVVVDYALVPKTLISSSGLIEGESENGVARKNIPPGIALLSGFSLEYISDDFKMKEFGILARQPATPGPNIEVYFNDKSQNRNFKYKVAYSIMK
jgi:hypothetical protein